MAKRDRECDNAQPAGSSIENQMTFGRGLLDMVMPARMVAESISNDLATKFSRSDNTNSCATALQLKFASSYDGSDDVY